MVKIINSLWINSGLEIAYSDPVPNHYAKFAYEQQWFAFTLLYLG